MHISHTIFQSMLYIFLGDEESYTYFYNRFPRAGLANAESTLRLLEVEIGVAGELCVSTRHLRHDLKQLAPWHEYLVRVGWVPNGQQ